MMRLDSDVTIKGADLAPNVSELKKTDSLSKKIKKKKSSVVVASSLVSVSDAANDMTIDEKMDEDAFPKLKNNYLEAVAKKLRALRKKLQRTEKYEAMLKSDLNQDQIQLVAKKSELLNLIKEFEDLTKILVSTDAEEQATNKKILKIAEAVEAKKIFDAVQEEMVNNSNKAQKNILRLLYVFNVALPNSSALTSISAEQFNALNNFKSLVTGLTPHDTIQADFNTFVESAEPVLQKYLAHSEEEFMFGVSFNQIEEIVSNIISPPPVPKFGFDEEETYISPEVELVEIIESTEQTFEETVENETTQTVFNSSEVKIQFRQDSEVLETTEYVKETSITETYAVVNEDSITVEETFTTETQENVETILHIEAVGIAIETPISEDANKNTPNQQTQTSNERFHNNRGRRGRGSGYRGGRGGYFTGGYQQNREGGYRDGGYQQNRDGGYQQNREGGYQQNRDGYAPRENGYRSGGGQRGRGNGYYRGNQEHRGGNQDYRAGSQEHGGVSQEHRGGSKDIRGTRSTQ
ncbi:hypothetical protein HK096_006581 [Nowakowskiella sp. JEL0078]|nr:hypothetical protein HK096_006581 [Nowakowskiella sp. JEL0078]